MFFKKDVLINFVNFTGKHLYWSLILIKLQAQVKFAKLLRTPFFIEHLRWFLLFLKDQIFLYTEGVNDNWRNINREVDACSMIIQMRYNNAVK